MFCVCSNLEPFGSSIEIEAEPSSVSGIKSKPARGAQANVPIKQATTKIIVLFL